MKKRPMKKVRRKVVADEEPSLPAEATDLATLQQQNVENLMRQSLKKSDPWQATIGVQTSQLVMLGNRLCGALDDALGKAEDPLEEFNEQLSSVEALLKLNRQVDRFARLNHELDR